MADLRSGSLVSLLIVVIHFDNVFGVLGGVGVRSLIVSVGILSRVLCRVGIRLCRVRSRYSHLKLSDVMCEVVGSGGYSLFMLMSVSRFLSI